MVSARARAGRAARRPSRVHPHQSSGVPVDDAALKTYALLQKSHQLRWITFAITDDKRIAAVASGDVSKKGRVAWEEFTSKENMPDGECRYGVFDLDIAIDDGVHERENSKIVFVNWADDTAKIKTKMVFASSKDRFRRALEGVAVDYQVRRRRETERRMLPVRTEGS